MKLFIMIKHPDYWLEDGSVLVAVEDTVYRLCRSLITRLSPRFFDDCCQRMDVPDVIAIELDSLPCFAIQPNLKISKSDFDAVIGHIHHDITLSDDAPLAHILRLYIVSSKGNFQKIHHAVEKQLGAYMQRNPLEIDFSDYGLLKDALVVSNRTENQLLGSLLKRALYYSYATNDDITFGDETSAHVTSSSDETSLKQSPESSTNRITGSDAAICERVMSQLSECFSPTLFQPPAALHMQCTDVFASLWMERAVQPAFTDNGTANPFMTLRRLRSLDWKRETGGIDDERSQPCSECLELLRRQWSDEAQSIWEAIDDWLVE